MSPPRLMAGLALRVGGLLLVIALGCGDSAPPPACTVGCHGDAGTRSIADAGMADVGPGNTDAAGLIDAATDAGRATDAGSLSDGGTGDAGTATDAPRDAATVLDAGPPDSGAVPCADGGCDGGSVENGMELPDGADCRSDGDCASLFCVGVASATEGFSHLECRSSCVLPRDLTAYCQSDGQCCEGMCCLGCGDLEGLCVTSDPDP